MIENRYPERYQAMCNAKATSDDEVDPVSKIRYRKRRPERSDAAEVFIRSLEEAMKRQYKARGKVWTEREPHPLNQSSELKSVPMGMPLDYYLPDVWRAFAPAERYSALRGTDGKGRPKIAFLPKPGESFGQGDEESKRLEALTDDEFFNVRASVVLPLYNYNVDSSPDNMETD
ncbi:hypothetical protein V5O48_019291 [Marasmius crinis-equi]|uniref:Uncharacterized protein n=1 Tax=Marasmius crinis-equi TaxID=585013 RepID=A0ABR3EIT3_9AGAR